MTVDGGAARRGARMPRSLFDDGLFGAFRPWYAQLVSGWEPDPEHPLQRRKLIARREGPFRTRRVAEAYIARQAVVAPGGVGSTPSVPATAHEETDE